MTTEYNQKKRAESIAYLKERNKYLLDANTFIPTSAVATDVGKTIKQFLKERNKYLLDANTFIPTSAVATDVGKTIEQFLTNQNTQFTRRCHK